MLIKCDAKVLADVVGIVGGVVSGRPTLPILGTVLLSADASTLTVSATNLDQSVVMHCEALEVERPGSICLPHRLLQTMLAEQCGEITIDADTSKQIAVIVSATANYVINGYSPEEFPTISSCDGKECSLEEKFLRTALSMVAPAMSHDETRFILCGVCFWCDRRALHVVATDGRRLHSVETTAARTGALRAVVPTDAVKLLLKNLNDGDAPVEIVFGKDQASFHVDGKWTVTTKLIDGKYPNWRAVIPPTDSLDKHIAVDRRTLMGALRQVMVVLQPAYMFCRLVIDGSITAIATPSDVGSAVITMGKPGEEVHPEFTVNPIYMMDAVKNISRDDLCVFVAPRGDGPVVINAGEYLAVVMPCRAAAPKANEE